jgi:hypothetical protein
MSQSKQGVEMLRSDDAMPCIARIWDVLSVCCGCIVRCDGNAGEAAIAKHFLRTKGSAVLVACIANLLSVLANISLDQSGCLRVAALISPHSIIDCLALEQLLWSDASSEISSENHGDIVLAILKCVSSSSNVCTVASQASVLLTNLCLNKTAASVYCFFSPLLVTLDQARKSLNDAGANPQMPVLFSCSHQYPTPSFQLAHFSSILVTF